MSESPGPGAEAADRRARLLIVALIFPAAALFAYFLYAPCDDTYIFLVYAKNLLAGNGLTYNGARVEGFTSVLWVLAIAALGATGVPLPAAATTLSAASGLGALLATHWLGRRGGLPPGLALVPVALLAASGDFAFYLGSGMETVAFGAAVPLAIGAGLAPDPAAALRTWKLPALLVAMVLIRPEGVLVGALVVVALGLRARDAVGALRCALVCALLLAPVLLARVAYYGDWLPNTYYAKVSAESGNLAEGLRYLGYATPRHGIVLAAAAVLLGVHAWRRDTAVLTSVALPLAAVVTLAGYVAAVGGDILVGARFLVPALAPLLVATVQLAAFLPRSIAWGGGAVAAAALVLGFVLPQEIQGTLGHWRKAAKRRHAVGMHLHDQFPPETLVALSAAGIIPYRSGLPTLDMLGLNDVHIAHHGRRDPGLPFGHQKGDGAYVLSREPGVIVFGPYGTRRPGKLMSDQEIFESPTFHDHYAPQQIARGAWIWVRKPER